MASAQNADDMILDHEGTPFGLVETVKYPGMLENSDIVWEFHAQYLCQNTNDGLSLLRRLRCIFPRGHLQV